MEDKLTTTGKNFEITLSDVSKRDLSPEQVWCKLKKQKKSTSAT